MIAPVASELKVASPTTYRPAIEAMTAPPDTRIEWPEVCGGDLHRVEGGAALGPLLALALEVEERVVDADGHADQHDHAADGGLGGTRYDSGAMMPIVAATLVAASSTGMPAAISAPNASSISTSVTGRLNPSAAERSSATRSLMLSSIDDVAGLADLEVGLVVLDRVGHVLSSGPASSWSRASWISISSADRSGFHCGSETCSTPATRGIRRASPGGGSARLLVERAVAAAR